MSRPQLMRALSDFDNKRVRRRYVCLGLFVLGCVMASIVVYGIVRAASHTVPSASNATEEATSEEATIHHHPTTILFTEETIESKGEEGEPSETPSEVTPPVEKISTLPTPNPPTSVQIETTNAASQDQNSSLQNLTEPSAPTDINYSTSKSD